MVAGRQMRFGDLAYLGQQIGPGEQVVFRVKRRSGEKELKNAKLQERVIGSRVP
jgi:hypothetical protein